ncbi:MAG: glucosaminidase domain-containing protein [Prevotellaceae bacterium]|nr:glucosaminidase domain-containing protein [Prevotellaceae bacterium]
MKKIIYTSCFLLFAEFVVGQEKRLPQYDAYINQYSDIAVAKMKEFGIPASITLAQGILESGAGQSRLAVEANNHFGIKCTSDWAGDSIFHDDDKLQECFRKYTRAEDSYRDHSLFLTTRQRYASLFSLDRTDYESWAKGLKAAGYATDPNYPNRLVKIIEDYELYKYDTAADGKSKNTYLVEEKTENIPPRKADNVEEEDFFENNRVSKSGGKTVYRSNKVIGQVDAYSTHEVKEINGVKYITALENDTYEGIAEEFGLKVREIYSINDAPNPSTPETGEMVYIRPKKATSNTTSFHVVAPDETMRDIAQKYGIKLYSLYKKNNMQEGVSPLIGQRLILK